MRGNAWKLQVNIRPVFLYSNEAYRPNAQVTRTDWHRNRPSPPCYKQHS